MANGVGVPNPTGTTETYGFVAVEMQLAGCLVSTMECPGFLDTVVSPQAVLYNDPSKLAHSIISLLNQQNISHQKTLDEIFSKFNLVDIGEEWEKLFIDCIPNGSYLHDRNSLINPHYAFKWLREFNRRLNGALPKWLQLPPVLFVELALFKLKIRRPYYLKF